MWRVEDESWDFDGMRGMRGIEIGIGELHNPKVLLGGINHNAM